MTHFNDVFAGHNDVVIGCEDDRVSAYVNGATWSHAYGNVAQNK